MIKFKIICLSTVLLVVALLPLQLLGQISIEVDFATFRYDNTQSLTEIYYAIPVVGLEFIEKPTPGLQGQVHDTLDNK